jgi:demethylmenaquinone methyltransferase/2-methoxy-6-polyprenyl-1,4-benzoquinol methylase
MDQRRADTTHFGFRTVARRHKAALVREVFDDVAGRYDLMNDLMSGGVHRLWKAALVEWLKPRPGMHLVDVAGGTGDISFRVLDSLGGGQAAERAGFRASICDINQNMLEAGRNRALDRGFVAGVDWLCADAEALPLDDASVDAYTIAFGIRNVSHIAAALAEARRVLRPGGRFLCLEFSRLVLPGLTALYDAYSFRVLPALGEVVTGNREAYLYLAESIRRFPDQQDFAAMIAAAGLDRVRVRNLSGGIAALHSAWRL